MQVAYNDYHYDNRTIGPYGLHGHGQLKLIPTHTQQQQHSLSPCLGQLGLDLARPEVHVPAHGDQDYLVLRRAPRRFVLHGGERERGTGGAEEPGGNFSGLDRKS